MTCLFLQVEYGWKLSRYHPQRIIKIKRVKTNLGFYPTGPLNYPLFWINYVLFYVIVRVLNAEKTMFRLMRRGGKGSHSKGGVYLRALSFELDSRICWNLSFSPCEAKAQRARKVRRAPWWELSCTTQSCIFFVLFAYHFDLVWFISVKVYLKSANGTKSSRFNSCDQVLATCCKYIVFVFCVSA